MEVPQFAENSGGAEPQRFTAEQLEKLLLDQRELELMLQMSGAFAHEISQPLTVLLSNLDLLRMRHTQLDEKTRISLDRISGAAQCLADLIKRAQNIFQNHELYADNSLALEPAQKCRVAAILEEGDTKLKITHYLREAGLNFELQLANVNDLTCTRLLELAPQIILLDYSINDGKVIRFMHELETANFPIPVVLLTDSGAERTLANLLRGVIVDYLPKSVLSRNNFVRMLQFATLRYDLRRKMKLLENPAPPTAA